ncbi:MAG: acyl-CoA thioesterase [Xanthomonadaceae bacterium]|nr:acyl-CoA thioesterase [Xanthomonadaceae bacterium]
MSDTPPARLDWDVVYPHLLPVTVQPDDTDGMGHTNNVAYLGWLERVAWDHSHKLGMNLERYRALDAGCVVRRHELDYFAPTFAGEELLLGTWIIENDARLTMWRGYQIIRPADRKLVLRGKTLWVCVDMKHGRPRRMPPEFAVYVPAQPVTRG